MLGSMRLSEQVFAGAVYPVNYRQSLPKSSVLRACVDKLITCQKQNGLSNRLALSILQCLRVASERKQLPPLHWISLLAPWMRSSAGNVDVMLSVGNGGFCCSCPSVFACRISEELFAHGDTSDKE